MLHRLASPRRADADVSSVVAGGLSPFLMRDRRVTVWGMSGDVWQP
jgi:hypothetical protein